MRRAILLASVALTVTCVGWQVITMISPAEAQIQMEARRPPTPVEELQAENAALTKRVAALEARLAADEQTVSDLSTYKENKAYHEGFSHAFITKENWNGIPGNALIDYWAPDH